MCYFYEGQLKTEKKERSNESDTVLRQNNNIKELKLKQKYQTSNNDPTLIFYEVISD